MVCRNCSHLLYGLLRNDSLDSQLSRNACLRNADIGCFVKVLSQHHYGGATKKMRVARDDRPACISGRYNPDRRTEYVKWLLQERPDAVVVVSLKENRFIARHDTQRLLMNTFCEEEGYIDAGVNFGARGDGFQYRVLLRKEGTY